MGAGLAYLLVSLHFKIIGVQLSYCHIVNLFFDELFIYIYHNCIALAYYFLSYPNFLTFSVYSHFIIVLSYISLVGLWCVLSTACFGIHTTLLHFLPNVDHTMNHCRWCHLRVKVLIEDIGWDFGNLSWSISLNIGLVLFCSFGD